MMLDADLEAWLTLSFAPGLSNDAFRRLLATFGGPHEVLAQSRAELARCVPDRAARAVSAAPPRELLERAAQWLSEPGNHVITLADDVYPKALLDAPDPPPVLYAKGRVELLNAPAFAIVGSRNATQQGLAHAEAFARALSEAGFTIVSGLALGIDAAAHRGGLAGPASSVAVVGTGLDTVYPARNHELAHQLARDGCMISEFALGTAPVATNFPRRNRLIAGLARGCLVVEAALSSGSLITARLANEQGKEVFAIPGSIHSPLAKGCHSLIKQGAKLVETADDILDELQPAGVAQAAASKAAAPDGEPPHPALVHLGFDPCDFDTLVTRSGLGADALAALLTKWELEGLVEALPGSRYQRIR
ncbi:MAG TPA: DNA-processing protein DprA [Burkholderiales bacterium]|nr:DNA-processing protein DprA [Burkholderiales bacterium]